MTQEEAKELWPIVKAYSEGKTIEYLTTRDEWVELEDPEFSYSASIYRIKPETKYRPFKNGDECFEEMRKHEPFGWLKPKSEDYKTFIAEVGSASVSTYDDCYNYEYLFSDFEFIDGTPFGIREN